VIDYLLTVGISELKVVGQSVPFKQAVDDPNLTEEKREKLQWISEVRDFARDQLKLNVGASYEYYYDTGDGPAVYNLSASLQDKLEPRVWDFPFVGEYQYLGFFNVDQAKEYRQKLTGLGYDVFIYGAVAYSTGGFFRDPIYSSLLELDKPLLADTVVHELTHNTIFGRNNSEYVESIANYVGKKGSLEFIKVKAGEESELYKQAVDEANDRVLVNQFLAEVYDELSAYYARTDLTSEQKIEQREAVFQGARERFKEEVLPYFKNPDKNSAWGNIPTNNAWILLHRRYNRGTSLFESVYIGCGNDLVQAIEIFKQAGQTDDPYGYLENWVGSHH